LFSFLRKLKTKQNYAWDRFYFFTSLKLNKTMLEPEETFLEVGGFNFYTGLNQSENYACEFPMHGWYLAPNLRS
jgi:hypothetical protein